MQECVQVIPKKNYLASVVVQCFGDVIWNIHRISFKNYVHKLLHKNQKLKPVQLCNVLGMWYDLFIEFSLRIMYTNYCTTIKS